MPIRRGSALLAGFVIATGALYFLGAAGYRLGWLVSAAILIAGFGGATWRAGRSDPRRGVWLAAALVLGATATAWLVDHAPYSRPRVEALARRVHVDFATVVSEHTSGHSWCRPECPRVERTLDVPFIDPRAALVGIAGQMRLAGLLDELAPVARQYPHRFLHVQSPHARTEVQVARRGDKLRIVIRVTASRSRVRRPAAPQVASGTTRTTR